MPAASPVVKVGRIAGQFAKPRTSPTEKRGGVELPVYRGDIINGTDFTPEARTPDPRRQLEAYRQSAATLNLLRAFATGGYANLSNAHQWMLSFVKDSPQIEALSGARRADLTEALNFMRACGIDAGCGPGDAHDRFLHQPREPAARLRAGLTPRSIRRPAIGTAPPATWCGSATARARPITPTSSFAAASRIRSA